MQQSFGTAFWWLIVVRLTTEGGWIFVMEILDVVHLNVDLTHSFVYYSGCDFIPTNGTGCCYVIIYLDLYSFVAISPCNYCLELWLTLRLYLMELLW